MEPMDTRDCPLKDRLSSLIGAICNAEVSIEAGRAMRKFSVMIIPHKEWGFTVPGNGR